MKAGEPRVLIILPGTPTETTAHSRKRTRFIKTVLYFYHHRIILTSWWMTHSSGPLSEAYTGDLREMNHCVAAARAVKPQFGSARRVEELASQMRKKRGASSLVVLLLPPPRFTSSVSSLEPGDFNLSKLFTSMPPRLLLVCHEGTHR